MMGWWLAGPGVVYGQALLAVLAGTAAMIWAWRFVDRLAAITCFAPFCRIEINEQLKKEIGKC